MSQAAYARGLDRNQANHQPLTPLTLLERAAATWPDRTALVHGRERRTYSEFYARCRRLASALAKRGIGVGDTVSVMLPNVPSMLEAHYGVAMTGAVLHSMNTRLDAAIIAFMLDHAEAKVVITDREFAATMKPALEAAKVEPLVVLVGEAAVAGGDRVVAAWLDLHVVRGIRVDQMDRLTIKQPVDVVGVAAVAAEQPVIAQDPQVAWLRRRFVRRFRHVVRIRQTVVHTGVEQLRELLLIETKHAEIEVQRL